jgi:hypothetical protein
VKKAAALNLDGVKVPRAAKTRTPRPLDIPVDLAAALGKHRAALDTFEAFSTSHKREYVEWITEAKRDETRKKRLAQAIALLGEGKTRNWNYSQGQARSELQLKTVDYQLSTHWRLGHSTDPSESIGDS